MKWMAGAVVVVTALGMTGAGASAPSACVLIRQICVLDSNPQWSQDGQRIAFLRTSPEAQTMYSIAASGGDERRLVDVRALTDGPAPALSPDWSKVAFWYSGPLRVENVDGSDPHDVAPSFSDFAWAPDSRRLAYTSEAKIFVVNADGTGSTSLGPGRSPAWSPDGRQIAFIGSGGALAIMNSDGTGRRVVYSPGVSGGPSWSPDGNRLAFLVGSSLKIINLDGTQLRSFPGAFAGSPRWSHDGTFVAAGGVEVVNIELGARRSYNGSDPSWSPVANELAVVYDGPCIFTGVRLISVDRGSSRRLTLDCHFLGTPRNDTIVGTNFPDLIAGLAGNDTLAGEGDGDTIAGGSGADRILGGDFGDFLTGGRGNDLLFGGAYQQDAYAEEDDILSGGPGRDELRGGPGWDELSGDSGGDVLRGGADSDILRGGPGNDRLYARGDPGRGFGGRSGDMVDCGSGRHDMALVDRNDRVSRNCEVVRRR